MVIFNRPLRIALLSYRSKPHCGGQGVYIRHLSRELHALGHHVEVFSGQPYPDLDPGPVLHEIPSLDLYRDDDPFRTPRWREYRDWVDVLETAMMWGGAFPEPLTFSVRALRALATPSCSRTATSRAGRPSSAGYTASSRRRSGTRTRGGWSWSTTASA